MKIKKPRALRAGDTIAVVSASWGGPGKFPWVLDLAEENLKKHFGLKTKEFPHTRSKPEYLAQHPKERANDVNRAFGDKDVKAIISSIGGDDSIRVLPYLDTKVIRSNPKIFLGFSDTTTLLTYLNQLGLVTFHGPSMMAGWSQMEAFPEAFKQHALDVLFEAKAGVEYWPYATFSSGYLDWGVRSNIGKVKDVEKNDGFHWLNRTKPFSGTLFGGNIEVLEWLKGTRFWPEESFWKGKVLFLETSEEKPPVREVVRWLRNFAIQGVFEKVNGLLFGRARGYTGEEKKGLDKAILDVIIGEFGHGDLPVVSNLDFGHTDPQWILPLGIPIRVDPSRESLSLEEAAVSPR